MVHCVAMDTQVLLWFIAAAAAVVIALAGALLSFFHQLRKRSARFRSHALEYERRQQAAVPRAGITPDRSAAIRAHAERAAWRDWKAGAGQPDPANPYGTGSAQAVLWYASYQLALHDLVDAQAQAQQAVSAPPSTPSCAPAAVRPAA